jgi:hypothetical protein
MKTGTVTISTTQTELATVSGLSSTDGQMLVTIMSTELKSPIIQMWFSSPIDLYKFAQTVSKMAVVQMDKNLEEGAK